MTSLISSSAVVGHVFLHDPGIGVREDLGAAVLTNILAVVADEAVALARDVFDHLDHDSPLLAHFPKERAPVYAEFGKTLSADEELEFEPSEGAARPARVNAMNRQRLTRFIESPHTSTVELIGHVLEADVRQRRFQLWLDDRTSITASFGQEQEELVTSALKNYRSIRVRLRGIADISPQGQPVRFTSVEELQLLPDEPRALDTTAQPIEAALTDLASRVAGEEWARLPADLTDNLDHYLYGTPKR